MLGLGLVMIGLVLGFVELRMRLMTCVVVLSEGEGGGGLLMDGESGGGDGGKIAFFMGL